MTTTLRPAAACVALALLVTLEQASSACALPTESEQDTASSVRSVRFAAGAQIGTTIDVVMFRGFEQSRAGRTLIDGGFRVPVHIAITEPGGGPDVDENVVSKARWSLGQVELVPGKARVDVGLQTLAQLLDGLIIDFDLDRIGRPVAWSDERALVKALDARRDLLLEGHRDQGLGDAELASIKRQFEDSYRADPLRRILFDDLARFHATLGTEWTVGRVVEGRAELDNPFGEPAFPAQQETSFRENESPDATFTLENSRTLDPSQLRGTLIECFRRLETSAGTSPTSAAQLPEIMVEELERFELSPDDAWPRAVYFERRTGLSESAEVVRVEISRA